jgi:excisionase family DNA binding protein
MASVTIEARMQTDILMPRTMRQRDSDPHVPPGPTAEAMASYLTAVQIAELLQVSAKSIYRWAAGDPTFPRLKIGATVRFPRERLLRWLQDREQGVSRPRMRKPMRSAVRAAASEEVHHA